MSARKSLATTQTQKFFFISFKKEVRALHLDRIKEKTNKQQKNPNHQQNPKPNKKGDEAEHLLLAIISNL